MTKPFSALREHMLPAARARAEAKTQRMIREMALSELREALKLTQAHLAKVLHVNQSAISKLERRTDMYLSTLEDFVEAMGGRLEIRAVFPDGAVRLRDVGRLGTAAEAKR